jgi:hypothetical protein
MARAAWSSIQGLPPKMWVRRTASQLGMDRETIVSAAPRHDVKYPRRLERNVTPTTR